MPRPVTAGRGIPRCFSDLRAHDSRPAAAGSGSRGRGAEQAHHHEHEPGRGPCQPGHRQLALSIELSAAVATWAAIASIASACAPVKTFLLIRGAWGKAKLFVGTEAAFTKELARRARIAR